MTNPVERERKKYQWQKFVRRLALANRVMFWLPIAFVCCVALLAAIFGK
jgi:hypothetical protein